MRTIIAGSKLSGYLRTNSRNIEGETIALPEEVDEASFSDFLNDPDAALMRLAENESGEVYLELMHSIYASQSAADVRDKMANIDTGMAAGYESQIAAMVQTLPSDGSRLLYTNGKLDLKKIKLNLSSPVDSRGFLSADWNWDTVYWYLGFCAATTAGLAVYRFTPITVWFGIPKYAGLVAAIAGAGSMTAQLYKWYTTEEGKFLVSAAMEMKDLASGITSRSTKDGAIAWAKKYLEDKGIGFTGCWAEFVRVAVEEYFSPTRKLMLKIDEAWTFVINRNEFGLKLASSVSATAVPVAFCLLFCQDLITSVADWVKYTYNSTIGQMVQSIDANLKINGFLIPKKI